MPEEKAPWVWFKYRTTSDPDRHRYGAVETGEVNLSEFELSGPIKNITTFPDGSMIGFYNPATDGPRYYSTDDGRVHTMTNKQSYYRPPYSEIPMHQFENPTYIGTMFRETPVTPPPTAPNSINFDYELDSHYFHSKYQFWSVGAYKHGWVAGAYTEHGDAIVAHSDIAGKNWNTRWAYDTGAEVESVSGFIPTSDGEGINILTERSTDPFLYIMWNGNGGEMSPLVRFPQKYMYLFANEEAVKLGWCCVCSNRNVGGYLAKWDGSTWSGFTPDAFAEDGHPLLIWDACIFNNMIVAACARGIGEYQNDDAGRLLTLVDNKWVVADLRCGGITQLLKVVENDQESLYLTTAKGEVLHTTNCRDFNIVMNQPERSETRLLYLKNKVVGISFNGKIYVQGTEQLSIPNITFINVRENPYIPGILAGTYVRNGKSYSIRINYY